MVRLLEHQRQARFQLGDTSGTSAFVEGPPINDGRWHHLVGAYDGVNERILLYVDGELAGEADQLRRGLRLGHRRAQHRLARTSTPGYHFHGNIDEVALHRRVLSPTEVANHYYIPRGYCVTCETPVRLMFLGDSITGGQRFWRTRRQP